MDRLLEEFDFKAFYENIKAKYDSEFLCDDVLKSHGEDGLAAMVVLVEMGLVEDLGDVGPSDCPDMFRKFKLIKKD